MTAEGRDAGRADPGDGRRDRLLLDPDTRVTCPHCEREFGLGEGFAKRSLEALARASEEALAGERQSVEAALERRLAREAAERERQSQGELASLRQSLAEKAGQVATLQRQELELRRERARLEDARQALELEAQRRLDEQRREIEDRVRAGETERSRLREAELQKTIDDMRSRLEEAQRKGAQGSQQLQGEVLELLLEEQLAQAFPLDAIAEVRKGVRGGDALHTVVSRSGQAAGAILWEAKRAQKWGAGWAAKLREDMRAAGAEAGVVVTTSFPAEWPAGQPFGLHEHVWVDVARGGDSARDRTARGPARGAPRARGECEQGREDGGCVRLPREPAVRAQAPCGVRGLHEDAGRARQRARHHPAAVEPPREADPARDRATAGDRRRPAGTRAAGPAAARARAYGAAGGSAGTR